MSCTCPEPIDTADPRRDGDCARCGKSIRKDVLAGEQIAWFYNRLEEAIFPRCRDPRFQPDQDFYRFQALRSESERREQEGRPKFGLTYFGRRNLKEAGEEVSDENNYRLFEICVQRQRAGEDRHEHLLFQAAYHAYHAWKFDREYEALSRQSDLGSA